MYPEAYREWLNLFNDDFLEIWQHERKELQKVALLFSALQSELKNIQTNVEIEVSNLKQQLKYKDDLKRRAKSTSPTDARKRLPSVVNKENEVNKRIERKQACEKLLIKDDPRKESPDLFKNIDQNAPSSSTDISVIDLSISDDDPVKTINSPSASPTIKKRRKRYRLPANPPAFNIISEMEEKPETPNTSKESVKTNLFKTPTLKPGHDVSSIIECTPQMVTKKSKTSSRISNSLSKKKSSIKKRNTTLTQLFRSSLKTANEKTEDGVDSDETYYEDNVNESKIGITELIHYINKDDSCKQANIANQSHNSDESICQELETSSQEVDEFSKGAIFNDEDLNTSTEKPRRGQIDPEPIVRGNARKQLHGWSCQQCRNFYGSMNLSPEELQKKMDECSRHRYKYNPPEETIPGFWDLSIPPEKLE